MSTLVSPLNFRAWIEENRDLLKPPVGNKCVWKDGEFIVMVVGGPNNRKDYHYNETPEFFYQIEGDIILKIIENGKSKNGDLFLESNLNYINEKYGSSMEYITGDGGIDFSIDFNNQEEMSLKLIYVS